MPFDGSNVMGKTDIGSLHQHLLDLGFCGILPATLDEHKQREVERHPPNFLYRHQNRAMKVLNLFCNCTIAGAAAAITISILSLVEGMEPTIGLGFFLAFGACWGSTIGMIFAAERMPIRGPVVWNEQRIGIREVEARCPPAITEMARTINRSLWAGYPHRTAFLYGELRQMETVLDPYLIICDQTTQEQVILAVWDGDTILHSATRG
jgi:hypothetical protein